jgi:hypothetical protein
LLTLLSEARPIDALRDYAGASLDGFDRASIGSQNIAKLGNRALGRRISMLNTCAMWFVAGSYR